MASSPTPVHYDKLGRIINEGAKVLAAVDHDALRWATVEKLCPVLIRIRYPGFRGGELTRLQDPKSVVVWNG